jgi:hypothetical protein
MLFDKIAESRIREAMQEGAFDDLEGAGQPLSLEEYFATPEDVRMAYSILRSNNCVPTEVELLNDVRRLERAVEQAPTEAERDAAANALGLRRTELAIAMERRRPRSAFQRR